MVVWKLEKMFVCGLKYHLKNPTKKCPKIQMFGFRVLGIQMFINHFNSCLVGIQVMTIQLLDLL